MGNTVGRIRSHPWLAAALFVLAVLLAAGGMSGKARADGGTASGTVNATVVINTIEVVSVTAPETVAVGERFRLAATVANNGATRIQDARATLQLPAASSTDFAFSVKGKSEKKLGAIKPLGERDVKWNLVAEECGFQIIQVTATGIEQASGAALEDQGTVIVEVGSGACGPQADQTDKDDGDGGGEASDVPGASPVANEQSLVTEEGTPISITLTGSGPDGDTLTYALVATTTHGTLEGAAPELTYTPDAGFTGDDSFTFTVSYGPAESLPAEVLITVADANDSPAADEQPDEDDRDDAGDATAEPGAPDVVNTDLSAQQN